MRRLPQQQKRQPVTTPGVDNPGGPGVAGAGGVLGCGEAVGEVGCGEAVGVAVGGGGEGLPVPPGDATGVACGPGGGLSELPAHQPGS